MFMAGQVQSCMPHSSVWVSSEGWKVTPLHSTTADVSPCLDSPSEITQESFPDPSNTRNQQANDLPQNKMASQRMPSLFFISCLSFILGPLNLSDISPST